ncbi:hypothetical protein M9458_048704, partial [Cirrhinus mrigala]
EMPFPTATDILRVLESDFSERNSEGEYVSQEDVRFIQLLREGIQQKEIGHLEMPLPFKSYSPPTLPNKKLAIIRLQHLKRKLRANQQYYEYYKTFMEKVIRNGDAELAPEASVGNIVWYIPHHGVYHPKKPGKLRVVFDCSAKFHGIYGPDLINFLVGVLCRFRKESVAIICDISFLSCLNIAIISGSYGEASSYGDSSPGCANFGLENSFYVDDGLVSIPTIKEASVLK